MSKDILEKMYESTKRNKFIWTIYFLKIDRRNRQQPYRAYKVRFKNSEYLPAYGANLLETIKKYQIDPISEVQEYDGENTKITCDKISSKSSLLSKEWDNMINAIMASSDDKIEGRLHGYILEAKPINGESHSISFIKMANPFTNMTNKKRVIFKTTVDDELDQFSDDVCRLYLTIDVIEINNILYTFNHNFEKLFNLQKTMAKVKEAAINSIVDSDVFSDKKDFKTYAMQYRSSRTFITLKNERLNRVKDESERKKVAEILNLKLDEDGKFIINTQEDAANLIKYLCYKIFQESDTNDILEASTVTKININQGSQ